jgi:ketosteroid isomerase-like protein
MRRLLAAVLLMPLSLAVGQDAKPADGDQARAQIRALIDQYTHSIDVADPELGAKIWLATPEASFIHPLGEESGWDQIAADVYLKLMGQTFTKRSLKLAGEPAIHVYGDAAVAEFHWDFVATLRSNGSEVHTKGRESQVYVKLPDKGWRLVHVHYSGPAMQMPASGNF